MYYLIFKFKNKTNIWCCKSREQLSLKRMEGIMTKWGQKKDFKDVGNALFPMGGNYMVVFTLQ